MKTPITWIIDDPAPVISVFYEHRGTDFTEDGRPIIPTYPNEGLYEFCDIIERNGIRGKFSVVPMPGNKGDVVNGLDGVPMEVLQDWMDCVKSRVMPAFTIGPEMLTHHKAVDIPSGKDLPMNERDWASTQNRETLTPYIAKALSILKEAGIKAIGVTSPWDFGIEVEEEYEYSISKAVQQVNGSDKAWFFLRSLRNCPNAKPWVAYEGEGRILVSIPSTTHDIIWSTINCPRTDDAYISRLADELITADGKKGEIIEVLETGGYPILITHWQSLMSNGLGTGLKVMDEVGRRIKLHLSEQVEWMNFEQVLDLVVAQKEQFPKPVF